MNAASISARGDHFHYLLVTSGLSLCLSWFSDASCCIRTITTPLQPSLHFQSLHLNRFRGSKPSKTTDFWRVKENSAMLNHSLKEVSH